MLRLVNRAVRRREMRFQGKLAEGFLVLVQVVLENLEQRFGLLRTEIDALEIIELHLIRCLLTHRAKHEEEVPHAHPDLDAVGIVVAIIRRL